MARKEASKYFKIKYAFSFIQSVYFEIPVNFKLWLGEQIRKRLVDIYEVLSLGECPTVQVQNGSSSRGTAFFQPLLGDVQQTKYFSV